MSKQNIRIDIISDVMCPWCIVGYKKLMRAVPQFSDRADFDVHWHPFELNPDMPPEGEDLREHLAKKYGSTPEQSKASRQRLTDIGTELGFSFNYSDDMRVYNTFKAHQLLHWAGETGAQNELKLALFEAFFTRREDVSQESVLLDVAESVGLDRAEAQAVLKDQRFADITRQKEQFWIQNGINGVPAVVFDRKYLITGAQDSSAFAQVIDKVLEEKAAA